MNKYRSITYNLANYTNQTQTQMLAEAYISSPVWVEDVRAIYLHAHLVVEVRQKGNLGLAEDDEEIALAGIP